MPFDGLGLKLRVFLAVALAAFLLSGCASTPARDRNIIIGAGVGAGIGALIGSAAGGPATMWAGAAIGAASGGLVGALVKNEACYFRNRRGEVWQVACDDPRVHAEACFVGTGPGALTQVDCPRRRPRL